MSKSAFAQSDTVNNKNGRVTFNSSAITRPKPRVILNGMVFNGNFDQINPDSIMDVQVLKGKNATALYGQKAINGVIVIRTKRYKTIDTTHQGKLLDSVVIRIK